MPGPRDEAPAEDYAGIVKLYWIPLGAGEHFVHFNGMVYEALTAAIEHRRRCDIYHSVLEIIVPSGRYIVEVTPVPDRFRDSRGVVAEGPVGLRGAGRIRLFRYEVRRWRDGVVPDLAYAVSSPVVVTGHLDTAERILDVLDSVPTPTWGRDELHAGEMWSCNSVISWALACAGLDPNGIPLPPRARAPGWMAGQTVARRGY